MNLIQTAVVDQLFLVNVKRVSKYFTVRLQLQCEDVIEFSLTKIIDAIVYTLINYWTKIFAIPINIAKA